MSINGSPPKNTNMATLGDLFGSEQRPDDNVGELDNNAGNTPGKDTQFGQPTNQFLPPLGYSYPPSQPPYPCASQFYHPAPFNMTPARNQALVAQPNDNLFTSIFCSHQMLMNGSPPKTTNMAMLGGLLGSEQRPDDNVGE